MKQEANIKCIDLCKFCGAFSHLDRVKYMSFGVQKWLYDKALNGCEESLFKIDYGYNLHEEVINKAKEEKLI